MRILIKLNIKNLIRTILENKKGIKISSNVLSKYIIIFLFEKY